MAVVNIMATIVTCYFKLDRSKASHGTYSQWMKNMLVNDNPMVIFCDDHSAPIIRELRPRSDNTEIIALSFEEFYCYKYINEFTQHLNIDPEKNIGHSVPLYMIWNEKSHFLKRAIELNPFSTDYFLWVDIGCFRVPNTEYLHWPNPERIVALPKNKVLLLSVVPFKQEELKTNALENLPSFLYTNRIGAPIFGGDKTALLAWHDKYYEMLEYFIRVNRFIGKDQTIMNCVYLLNRDLCSLVDVVRSQKDPWFFLQEFLN